MLLITLLSLKCEGELSPQGTLRKNRPVGADGCAENAVMCPCTASRARSPRSPHSPENNARQTDGSEGARRPQHSRPSSCPSR